jgi:peroxiredoxin
MKNYFSLITKLILLLVVAHSFICFIPINGKVVIDFKLQNVNGKLVSLNDYPKAKGFIIVFTCNHCPFAKLYPPRMNDLNIKYKTLGVPLIAICSTDSNMYEEDSFIKMIKKSKEGNYNFPYLCDGEQKVAKSFSANKTPHAFVIWKENDKWVIKYNGTIDDNGAEPEKVTEHYVSDAVDALLKGMPVNIKETKSLGCAIHYKN